MNLYIKSQYRPHLFEYLKQTYNLEITSDKKSFICPLCKENSASLYPNGVHGFYCVTPDCSFQGDIFDLVRKTKNPNFKDEDVADYLQHKFKIEVKDDTNEVIKMYAKNNFCLFPLEPGTKDPQKGFMWTEKEYNNPKIWKDWVERGYGLALRLGKVSKVLAIDIDSDKTYEQLKDLLGEDTLIQTTKRGKHWIFCYDEAFDSISHANLRNKGYDMEIRANNAYIAVAPTSAEGEIRKWNYKRIRKMPDNLKDFLVKLIKQDVKSVDEEIQEAIDKEQLPIVDLSGQRNDTFVKTLGVFSKWMPSDTAYKVMSFLSNYWIDKPIPKQELNAMFRQIKKYRTYDKQELADEVLQRLDIIKEATAFQIAGSLKREQKDIEDVLKHLEDTNKVIHLGHRKYQRTQEIEWTTDKNDMSVPVDFEVPYFHDYAHFDFGNMLIIGSATGQGKCFGQGTKILMYDGSYKNVEDIEIGDKVMGVDSTPRNVLKLSKGVDTLYKIIPNKGKECIVNSRHILSLKRTQDQNIVNISLNDYLKQNNTFKHLYKLYHVSVDFPEQKLPIDPYFLGLWLGDGDSRDTRICSKDKEIISYIESYAKKLNLDFVRYEYNNHCGNYKISSGLGNKKRYNLLEEFRNLNILQNKHIPDIYKYNSKENRLKLFAGLIDSDGYYHDSCFEIICKYRALADDIRFLAGSLGFQVNESIKKVKLEGWTKARKYIRLSIIGDCTIVPSLLKRKQAPKRKMNKDWLVTGFKVKKLKEGKYYGFTLDGDNLHMIEDFFVHHNTHITANIIKKLTAQGVKPYLINTEAGSKIGKITQKLGIPDEMYYVPKKIIKHPMDIELVDNAITIVDWLKVKDGDYAKTDMTYEYFHEQLKKHKGFLIILTQLRTSNNEFFACDQVQFYGSLVAKYMFGNNGSDATNTFFQTTKIRDSKTGQQHITIPSYFDRDTKILEVRK